MNEKVLNWLAGYDTGRSSLSIVSYMERDTTLLAQLHNRLDYPRDSSDLGRCIRLMDIEPSYRERIGEMANAGPEWARLVAWWDELEKLYRQTDHRGRAHECYVMMQALIQGKSDEELERIMRDAANEAEEKRRRYIADTEYLYNR